jgi:hypothetical protein
MRAQYTAFLKVAWCVQVEPADRLRSQDERNMVIQLLAGLRKSALE